MELKFASNGKIFYIIVPSRIFFRGYGGEFGRLGFNFVVNDFGKYLVNI